MMYYRSFSKYLVTKEVMEGFKTELEMRSRTGLGVENSYNLSISLSIGEKVLNIAFKEIERAIKAQFLWKQS